MAAASRRGLRAAGTTARGDGAVAGLHVGAAVAFVGADGSRAAGAGGRVTEGAGTFEFTEDGFFVVEEVADQPIAVPFVRCQATFDARAEDTKGEVVGEGGDEGFVGGGKLDEAGEVGGDGV